MGSPAAAWVVAQTLCSHSSQPPSLLLGPSRLQGPARLKEAVKSGVGRGQGMDSVPACLATCLPGP